MLRKMAAVGVLALFAIAPAQKENHKANYWQISVRYPRFSAKGPVARTANAASVARERAAYTEFLRLARRDVPKLKKKFSVAEYQLEVKPHRITDRPGLASGYVDRYDFRAGAHGMSTFEVVNYALVAGKVRPLMLRDLFRPGTDAVAVASRALVRTMRAEKNPPSNVADGSWTRLTAEQRDRFVVGPNGVLFLFDQYDLGVGAEGPHQALVPFSALPGLDRNGALKPLFTP